MKGLRRYTEVLKSGTICCYDNNLNGCNIFLRSVQLLGTKMTLTPCWALPGKCSVGKDMHGFECAGGE